MQGPSPAPAEAGEDGNMGGISARKQEAAAALRRAAFLQSVPETSQPNSSPPLLRHSNSLESSVNRAGTSKCTVKTDDAASTCPGEVQAL
eukprot:scaffold35655_cov17-Tisochrysis_lutea.AAC.4